jgi:hypothetical protein
MSVHLSEEAGGKVLTLDLSGKITAHDYEHFTPEIDRLIRQHTQIRMLVRMHDFHGWSLGALWEDFKFGVRHFSHIERLAFVGDRKWEAAVALLCRPFTRAVVHYFDESRADQAATWIHEGSVQPV